MAYREAFGLIQKGINVDEIDTFGQTSLFYAAKHKHDRVIELLVKSGARVNLIDKNGQTPLFYASASGSIPCLT